VTLSPRGRKVLGDIAETPFRTALAVAAMAAGAFGLGMILTSWSVLTRELAASYEATRPASAVLSLDAVDDRAVDAVRGMPEVGDAEARPVIRGRLRVAENEWVPLVLFVVRDFDDLRLDRLGRDTGAWPPGDGEVLLERSCLSVARAGVGDTVTLRAGGGPERTVHVAGTLHAPGLAPGWMDHIVSGFVTWSSVIRTESAAESAQLRVLVARDRLDEGHIREVAARVGARLEAQGHTVRRVEVPAPGRHPHADQMDTFLFLLGAFGALTLALSAILVANMIHALLGEQVRQVGVMKAIGASTRQVASLYLGQVAILAAASLCIGLPLGLAAGRGYARFAGGILNASLRDTRVPARVMAIQIAVGLAVPLLVSLGPVARASRLTIHEAFSDAVGTRPFGMRRFDLWLARIAWLPRPLMLSLRTAFHRRGRLALTVGTLAAGGAVFIAALNVSGAWSRALAQDADASRYDLDVRLSQPSPINRVEETLAALREVERSEYWAEASAELVDGAGRATTHVNLFGPDTDTTLLRLRILAGRRLGPEDGTAVVVNQGLLASDPALRVGGPVVLRVGGRDSTWTIVGVAGEMNPHPTAYAPPRAVLGALGQAGGTTRGVRVVTRRHEPEALLATQREIDTALRRAGIEVADIQRLSDRRQAIADHLVIIESALLLAAALVVLVGGLGLASTLSLNVVERTRELGILSAIGAAPRTIAGHVVFEGVLMGALSWCGALLLAVPVTAWLDAVAGRMFHKVPLDFVLSPGAVLAWLALVVILAALSSAWPAWRAGRLAVREALAYE
jgi:putative ABC transport system permease protein